MSTDSVSLITLLTTYIVLVTSGQQLKQNESDTTGKDFETELIKTLFSKRSHMVPPYIYHDDNTFSPVDLGVYLDISSISGLDMRSQQLTFTGWFMIIYRDVSMSWNTSVYPVDAIDVKPEDIWRPELVIYNSVFPIDLLMKQKMRVKLMATGNILWAPGDTITTTCDVNIRYFPFDTQTCRISVGPWAHSIRQVNLSHSPTFTVVNQTAEWDVTEYGRTVHVNYHKQFWKIIYWITLRRKWLFYAMNMVLPVLLVSVLNSVVFVLPVECGEKMAVSLTTFLTLAVFMTLIQDSLPSNSDTVCYLAVYLATQMILSVLAVAVSAVRVACHHRRQTTAENSTLHVQPSVDIHGGQTVPGLCDKDGKKTVDNNSNINPKWRRVGVMIDRICFPVFTVLSLLSFAVYCVVNVF